MIRWLPPMNGLLEQAIVAHPAFATGRAAGPQRDVRFGSIATDAFAADVTSGPKWPKSGLSGAHGSLGVVLVGPTLDLKEAQALLEKLA
jgi:hypothetical protein